MRVETIGPATLYLGDCAQVLADLPRFDALVTDPPYGIRADENAARSGGKHGWKYHGETAWDRERPPPGLFEALLRQTDHQIIWGGNYFTDMLPPTMQWLIWDKCQRDFSLADFEVAWSSQWKASRRMYYSRGKALLDGKEHPTQKPVEVMAWCLDQLPAVVRSVLDPFMGSGTTGVAAVGRGLTFTGIEVDPAYFEIACRRIEAALRQPRLFSAPVEQPEQRVLFG